MRRFPMQRIIHVLTILLLLALAAQAPEVLAHGGKRPEKKGILLVAFGTSVPGAQSGYDAVLAKAKEAIPGVEIRMAYSSKIIRHKMAKEKKVQLDSPAEALARMMNDDFTLVAVQSLQTIPGEEFHGLLQTCRAFSGMPKGMERVVVGAPLLSDTKSLEDASKALLGAVPGRKPGEAVVFVGHGTHHPANVYYPGLQYYLWKQDKLAFVGTVEGSPSMEDVVAALKAANVKKAHLMPLLAVAGDHARNDIAGDEPDSWKSVLTKAGIQCVPVLKGTGEVDAIADIWVDHLKEAFGRLSGKAKPDAE